MNASDRPTRHPLAHLRKVARTSTSWSWVVHACLMVLMLLTQQVAWRHGLSHVPPTMGPSSHVHLGAQTDSSRAAHSTSDKHHGQHSGHHLTAHDPGADAAEAPCLQCLAHAGTAHSLWPSHLSQQACLLGHVCTPSQASTPHEASVLLAYRSRAPPVV